MAGNLSDGFGVGRSLDCPSSEALAEWRSSEQVDNGTPSTSPPYWDSDSNDDGALIIFYRAVPILACLHLIREIERTILKPPGRDFKPLVHSI
ncbi:hypothetical protein RJ641_020492 [Dillenia turbinata]|uniref:Uncharacterized protein n=1 Tax=Dillenia turbinata TaxID=194707 RepID=A0AAN8YWY7_9MAGN